MQIVSMTGMSIPEVQITLPNAKKIPKFIFLGSNSRERELRLSQIMTCITPVGKY